jgi:HK97 family phage portal protein
MSPLRAALKTLTNLNDTSTAASKLLANLGALGIIFKDGDSDFSKENAEALSRQYERKTGPSNIRKLLFAGAKLGYIKLSETANDLSLYDGARFSLQQLANIFGVSTILLNDPDNSATFANYEEAKKSLWTNVVLPLLSDIRDELNYKLLPLFNKRDGVTYYIDMDLSDIPELKINLDMNSQVADRSWWLTVGEKRELLGRDLFDDENLNDMILVPSGLVPIEESSLNFIPNENTLTNFEDDEGAQGSDNK